MVSLAAKNIVAAMSWEERFELQDYIDSMLPDPPIGIELSESQKSLIENRAAELESDPSIGLSVDELMIRVHELFS